MPDMTEIPHHGAQNRNVLDLEHTPIEPREQTQGSFAHLFERFLGLFGIESSIATHTAALVTAFVLITLLHVVLGELVPKTIAIDYPERTALFVAWPIRIFYRVFYPFIWAMNELANLTIKAMGLRPATEDERAHT